MSLLPLFPRKLWGNRRDGRRRERGDRQIIAVGSRRREPTHDEARGARQEEPNEAGRRGGGGRMADFFFSRVGNLQARWMMGPGGRGGRWNRKTKKGGGVRIAPRRPDSCIASQRQRKKENGKRNRGKRLRLKLGASFFLIISVNQIEQRALFQNPHTHTCNH